MGKHTRSLRLPARPQGRIIACWLGWHWWSSLNRADITVPPATAKVLAERRCLHCGKVEFWLVEPDWATMPLSSAPPDEAPAMESDDG